MSQPALMKQMAESKDKDRFVQAFESSIRELERTYKTIDSITSKTRESNEDDNPKKTDAPSGD